MNEYVGENAYDETPTSVSCEEQLTLPEREKPVIAGGVARNSSIELLKIFGILLIVFYHVWCTISGAHNSAEGITDYLVDLSASSNLNVICLQIFSCTGMIGNAIFFTCSARFLLDKKETNAKKMLRLVADLFFVNAVWLIVALTFKGYSSISAKQIVKSLLPFYNGMNWYVVYYVLFCFIAPFLNMAMKAVGKKKHFIIALALFILYLFLSVAKAYPGSGNLTTWVAVYFVLGYFKMYGTGFIKSKKANVIALFTSIGVLIALYLTVNFLGLKISFFTNKTLIWTTNCNFLFYVIAFASLNLVAGRSFCSKFINFVSSLSLVVYLIHDNTWMQDYFKPEHWHWIYTNLGYNLFWLWLLAYGLCLFLASVIIAAIYKVTFQKIVHFISDKIYILISKVVEWFQTKFIRVIR